jgi:hypothetical protein
MARNDDLPSSVDSVEAGETVEQTKAVTHAEWQCKHEIWHSIIISDFHIDLELTKLIPTLMLGI